jgi:hypothetical protein
MGSSGGLYALTALDRLSHVIGAVLIRGRVFEQVLRAVLRPVRTAMCAAAGVDAGVRRVRRLRLLLPDAVVDDQVVVHPTHADHVRQHVLDDLQ